MIELFTLLMTPVHTHLRTRHQRQSSAQVGCSGCSHGVRARVWEAPGAGSTPDYSAHRQARPVHSARPVHCESLV